MNIIICVFLMYYPETDTGNMQGIFLFLSAGFVAVNFIVMNLMQEILDKEEKIRIGVLTEQNQKNRLDAYQDREEIYERQRKKMHDYKNQLYTIQTLLKTGKAEEALSFTEKLTESVAVDLSAINTNHPVVNAVLNQKYRSMQEKNIAVILKVGDLHEICLNEEEIVVLLSNLLDNAIRESEKVLKKTGKAVIHIKFECEEETMILAIRNPVTEKVEIVNDTVKSKRGENHGIGLRNVKAVVEKYGGDMVLSCDDNEFKVVVICNYSELGELS
ncbi:MAG: ATP-binding protein [Clostridiales bacterium]|nr:ATP-binding protein [Clostridiales bacterium]